MNTNRLWYGKQKLTEADGEIIICHVLQYLEFAYGAFGEMARQGEYWAIKTIRKIMINEF